MAEVQPTPHTPSKLPWRTICFRFEAPTAQHVSVIGDFNDWDRQKHPLRQDAQGVWTCQMPLPAGRYAYAFVVDGETRPDPQCPHRIHTPSGTLQCVLEVSPPAP